MYDCVLLKRSNVCSRMLEMHSIRGPNFKIFLWGHASRPLSETLTFALVLAFMPVAQVFSISAWCKAFATSFKNLIENPVLPNFLSVLNWWNVKIITLCFQKMVSLWDVASLTMITFWPHPVVEDFLLLTSSNIQTPGTSKYVGAFVSVFLFL